MGYLLCCWERETHAYYMPAELFFFFFFRFSYLKYSNATAYNIVRFPSVEFSTLQCSVGYCCVVVLVAHPAHIRWAFAIFALYNVVDMCLWCVVIVIARDITAKRVSRLWPVEHIVRICVVWNAKTIASFRWFVWNCLVFTWFLWKYHLVGIIIYVHY